MEDIQYEVPVALRSSSRTAAELESLYIAFLQLGDFRQYLFDLSEDKRMRLLSVCRLLEVEEGEFLFHKGNPSDCLYVLLRGAVGIYDGHGVLSPLVATLRPGKVFGERGLVRKAPRLFSARAEVACALISISAVEFKALLEPAFRLRAEEKIDFISKHVPGAKNILPTMKEKLAYSLNMMFCSRGRRLLTQKKASDRLFFMISGECTVSQLREGTQHLIVTLGPGSLFGDESVLLSRGNSYSVDVTAEGTRVYTITKADLLQFVPEGVLETMRQQCELKFQTRRLLLSRAQHANKSTPTSSEPQFRLASPIAKRKLVFAQRMRLPISGMTRCESERLKSLRGDLCHYTPMSRDEEDERRVPRSPHSSLLRHTDF